MFVVPMGFVRFPLNSKLYKQTTNFAGWMKNKDGTRIMNVILCVDDNNGMMYNKRRQSRDRILLEDILEYSKRNKLYINEYSSKLFHELNTGDIVVEPEFLKLAGTGEYCFVEDQSLIAIEHRIEKLIIYKWNRRYPADQYLDITLGDLWKLIESKEFKGASHEKITKEIYIKCEN